MKKTYALLVVTLISACRFNITSPSPPNITINNSNSNTNTNDNTNNVSPVTPIVVIPPTTPTNPPVNGTPTNPTVTLPVNAQAQITALGAQYSALVHSCDYLFIDAMLVSLRATDQRWGYVCKRGSCSDISMDVIAYYTGTSVPTKGVTGTYEIDVIGNSCSPAATPQFLNLGFGATNVFSPTR